MTIDTVRTRMFVGMTNVPRGMEFGFVIQFFVATHWMISRPPATLPPQEPVLDQHQHQIQIKIERNNCNGDNDNENDDD